jgi:hypothetical protein
MKMRYLLLLLACCTLCVISATAFTVQTPTGISSGDLTPGTRLNIDTTVSFSTATSGSTFPGADTLQFYTDLDTARWNIAIVLNSVENPRPLETGRTVRISGFELEYPSGIDLKVRVSLEGVVPTVDATGDKVVMRIRQLDSSDNVRSGGEYIITKTVINPAEVQTSIIAAKADLQTFKAEIDAAKADGVDTAAADAKFNAAEVSLQSAEGAGSNVGSAQSYLNTARTAITDGRKLLEETIVQHAITTASGVLSEIDGVLDYFTTTRNMGSDSRVVLIASKRQSVKNQIDTARGNFDVKNYALAERQATDALDEGRKVLIEAKALQTDVESIPVIIDPSKPFMYVIIGVIVILIIGFVVIKKRRTWDELG